jgi:hypothetical protein
VLRERARVLARDRRHDMARAVRRELGAQHHGAARQVAAEAGGAAHHVVRVELIRLRAQLFEEGAAQVLLDLLLGLLDRDLGERGDGREMEELGRVRHRRAVAREQQHAADRLVPGADRHFSHDARRDRRRALLAPLARVAAQRGQVGVAARDHRRAQARHDDRDGAAGRGGGQLGDAAESVTAQHRVHHLQMDGAEPLDERVVAGSGVPRLRCGRGHRSPAYAAASCAAPGCAWSVSSPDSPVRIR